MEFHEKPAAILAVSALTNQSPYTRFSQSGGGSLEGFTDELPGRYRVNQYNLESALMYKGFSWQSEWHHKNIIDRKNGDSTTQLQGYYIQAGYFFHNLIDKFPKQLEIAARHARYRPDTQLNQNQQI